jgi:hypothetical protein
MLSQSFIPERFSSLLPQNHQEILVEKYLRVINQAYTFSSVSTASIISEFLDQKAKSLAAEVDYLKTFRDALRELYSTGQITREQFMSEENCVFENLADSNSESRHLKQQRKFIEEDLGDEVEKERRLKGVFFRLDAAFLERAYSDLLVSSVMGNTAKTKTDKTKKDKASEQSRFRDDVLQYYSAIDNTSRRAYCHLTGWWSKELVKAAHLVPRSLAQEDIGYLFGVGAVVTTDRRNGKHVVFGVPAF